ncbi:MAG: hypothetical protein IBX64_06360, partial [Actinobacteria bacterium]|nr:hypothetical protein [Actinomycetota bacterium]
MKKALVITLAAVFMLAMGGMALAELPGEDYPYADDGSSYWSYEDLRDGGVAKKQGGYAAFDSGAFSTNDGMYSNWTGNDQDGIGGPHGGYDTTTNKCKVCHAVHRAEGAYFLLRSDTQDDACGYCHLNGSAHSAKVVYDLNTDGRDTANGHTIGASSIIPDSSVYQTTEDVVLETMDENMAPISETVQVRRYDNKQNKMFRFARHHGHSAAAPSRSGYKRIGPLALRCMNCHQPHNAVNLIWNPMDFYTITTDTAWNGTKLTRGYKLLRKSPSASIWGTPADGCPTDYDQGMKDWTAYTEYNAAAGKYLVNPTNIITVPEETMTAANTGSNDRVFPNTIYTKYEGVGDAHLHGYDRDPQAVTQFALSPWCADCHNLNIGYTKELTHEELGFKSHVDRTHPVPYTGAYNGPGQCYSCHRNDLPPKPGTSFYRSSSASCEQCHFGTGSYAWTIAVVSAGTDSGYDFPHSGQDDAIKLLGNFSVDAANGRPTTIIDPTTNPGFAITSDNLDAVCIRCHGGIGIN